MKDFNLDSSDNSTVCLGVCYRTTGLSPRRDLSRKLCRSPYFMNGRMTMGFGKRSESTSKHTPEEIKSANRLNAQMQKRKVACEYTEQTHSVIPRSPMTLGWSKSFMHAASFRNSSISFWEKLSTRNETKAKYDVFNKPEVSMFALIWKKFSHFIVFTATFSDDPSVCLSCPSTTEPNSPFKIKTTVSWCFSVQHYLC